jgi:transcriptional regulator with XRE-family HTH domain
MDEKTLEDVISALTGRRLARLRVVAKLTQVELAEASGIKRQTIAAIERGSQKASPAQLFVLSRALGRFDYREMYPDENELADSDLRITETTETQKGFQQRVFGLLQRVLAPRESLHRSRKDPSVAELYDDRGIIFTKHIFVVRGDAEVATLAGISSLYEYVKTAFGSTSMTLVIRHNPSPDAKAFAQNNEILLVNPQELYSIALPGGSDSNASS